MKILRKIAIGILVLVGLVLVVSLFMPSTYAVERSRVIPSPPRELYAKFSTPRTWARWSAWTSEADPSLVYAYEGPDSGTGAIMKWTAKRMGNGRMRIVEAVPGRSVGYELTIEGSDMTVHGHVTFAPESAGTRVTWRDSGDLGRNPLYRLFGPMMDKMLGRAYETSFDKLTREARGG